MPKIAIISSSVRMGRKSHRVSLYLKNYLESNGLASVDMLDLMEYNFSIFTERLRLLESPDKASLDFAERVKTSDGILIVSPEYNGSFPASLKNVIDLLYDEWYRKPIGISTVSSGAFGGTQVIGDLQFVLWKMKAWTVPAMFPVPNINNTLDENGIPTDKESLDKRASVFINELLWCIQAKEKMSK